MWLGVVAAVTFGGLVCASFASGYHLVGGPAVPAASRSVEPGVGSPSGELRSAVVRQSLDKSAAVLRTKPDGGEVIEQLPAAQRVTILKESGPWLLIRYERQGKVREGWARAINLSIDSR